MGSGGSTPARALALKYALGAPVKKVSHHDESQKTPVDRDAARETLRKRYCKEMLQERSDRIELSHRMQQGELNPVTGSLPVLVSQRRSKRTTEAEASAWSASADAPPMPLAAAAGDPAAVAPWLHPSSHPLSLRSCQLALNFEPRRVQPRGHSGGVARGRGERHRRCVGARRPGARLGLRRRAQVGVARRRHLNHGDQQPVHALRDGLAGRALEPQAVHVRQRRLRRGGGHGQQKGQPAADLEPRGGDLQQDANTLRQRHVQRAEALHDAIGRVGNDGVEAGVSAAGLRWQHVARHEPRRVRGQQQLGRRQAPLLEVTPDVGGPVRAELSLGDVEPDRRRAKVRGGEQK
eukprot:scaffold69649_cov63-Phaeocystis_antarctica.AAC.1